MGRLGVQTVSSALFTPSWPEACWVALSISSFHCIFYEHKAFLKIEVKFT